VVGVEQWAELRRLHLVEGVSIKELVRRSGLARETVRRAVRSAEPPRYSRPPRGSKLDPFRERIQALLREEPSLPARRVRELIAEEGYAGSSTIVNEYVRELRPLYAPPRTYQRTMYRPGELVQFDVWEPSRPVPVGYGQARQGYVVVACLGYSRAGAAVLVFSKRTEDVLWGVLGCLDRLGGVPGKLVWDREGCLHAGEGRPTAPYAAVLGRLGVGWIFCEARDPQAKGAVERLQGYLETSFEPARRFVNELDYQQQLDAWFEQANRRQHATLRCRPADRLAEERLRPLPEPRPDVDLRRVLRVGADPYVTVDGCQYSLDPRLAGRRVELRVAQRRIVAVALDSGEIACRHVRSYARHRTITDPTHQAALEALRHARHGRPARAPHDPAEVERRPLSRYDQLIPA
jgi:transposase